MGQVFISYRHVEPDESLAEGLHQYLSARGFTVFLDKCSIEVGRDWAREIERQLQASRYFVVFLSEHSVQSDMVQHEVEIAYDLKRADKMTILPIRVAYKAKLTYDLGPFLRRIQSIDWNHGDSKERLFSRIHRVIRESTPSAGTGDGTPAPEPPPAKPRVETAPRAPTSHRAQVFRLILRKVRVRMTHWTRWGARQRLLLYATLALAGFLALTQVALWSGARRLQHELQNAPTSELFPLWKRYHWMTTLCLVDAARDQTALSVRSRLWNAAKRILDSEHAAATRPTADEWSTACQYFEQALSISSQGDKDKARLLYCKAQEALSEAELSMGRQAEEKRSEAVANLDQASRLDASWPEPFYGLVRSLADGTPPVVEKFEALESSARQKHITTDDLLFKMLRADAYLAAGKRLAEKSRSAGDSYDRELLEKAVEYIGHAIQLYDELPRNYRTAEAHRGEALSARSRLAGRLGLRPE